MRRLESTCQGTPGSRHRPRDAIGAPRTLASTRDLDARRRPSRPHVSGTEVVSRCLPESAPKPSRRPAGVVGEAVAPRGRFVRALVARRRAHIMLSRAAAPPPSRRRRLGVVADLLANPHARGAVTAVRWRGQRDKPEARTAATRAARQGAHMAACSRVRAATTLAGLAVAPRERQAALCSVHGC